MIRMSVCRVTSADHLYFKQIKASFAHFKGWINAILIKGWIHALLIKGWIHALILFIQGREKGGCDFTAN